MRPVDLAFETFGEPNGCPIIILHGFLASSRNWRTIAQKLALTHRVYALDMRNHGASPHADSMDYPGMAADVLNFMVKHKLEKSYLLGHSMGGKVAMWFALHYPERVESLIVADIAPVSYQHSFDAMLHALKQLPLTQLANRKQAEQHLASEIPDLSFRQFLLQNLLLEDGAYYWRINLDIIQKTAHNIVAFPEPTQPVFDQPALFITGGNSAYVNPDAVLVRFPRARIAEIPDTGHWLYVESPDAFYQLVLDWIT